MTGVEIAMIAGAALSAAGAVQQGNAAKQAGKFNAAVANNNAIASRQNASANAKRQAREARQRAGTNRANAAASGTYGDSYDLLVDNAMEEELDRRTIIHQGDLQAQGLEASAGLLISQGKQAQTAGYTSAAGSLLKGGGALYDSGAFDSTPKQTSPVYAGMLI
tara:strand:+ start:4149 stop:4640 length:492 start_codon:yes stop_codon:yes gene_type:complete